MRASRPLVTDLAASAGPSRAAATGYQPFAGQPPALVTATLDRILASRTFRRSQRHRTFLRHVVEAALDGRHAELKEVVIGLEVFGRPLATYDPRQDPIVRVEAGRVREKLARYYADEGADDGFEIQLPVGGYLPQLARRSATKTPTRSLGSFAVLPFTNLSADPDDAIFCEALAAQIVDLLSRVPGVRVVGRMSAIKARARSVDLKAVGKLLGVQHVIEGSVQRAGARYRLIAQLCRTRDRVCIWSQRFECEVGVGTDLFAFQDDVADAVTAAVARNGAAGSRTSVPPASTRGARRIPQARDLFERARYLVRVRNNEGLQRGIALLEESIALDPDFAPAHSQLGNAKSMYYGIMARPTLAAFREVEESARRALALDPLDGDARALIANIAFRVDRDWPRAEPLFREALALAPSSSGAHQSYAAALVFNGRYLEALEHARIALDLDPLNITVRIHLAVITSYARDYAAAVDEFLAVLDIEPDHYFARIMLGSAYLWAGAAAPAMTHFDAACRIAPDHPIAQFDRVFVHGLVGDIAGGRALLADLLARLEGRDYQVYNLAMAEAFLGDVAAACAALRRAADAHELLFMTLPADPSFDPYRDHPAFVALMEEYGLPRLPPSPFGAEPA
jgi:serine/threonine-protein kinase